MPITASNAFKWRPYPGDIIHVVRAVVYLRYPISVAQMAEIRARKPLPRTCGASIEPGRNYWRTCSAARAAENVKKIAPSGWDATQTPRAQAFRAESQRRHAAAQEAWDPASHPVWLNEDAYRTKIQPRLKNISTSLVASTLGVSSAYSSVVRKGQKFPHPRHWLTLAELAGVAPGK